MAALGASQRKLRAVSSRVVCAVAACAVVARSRLHTGTLTPTEALRKEA